MDRDSVARIRSNPAHDDLSYLANGTIFGTNYSTNYTVGFTYNYSILTIVKRRWRS